MFIIDDIINAIGSANAARQQEEQAQRAMDLQKQIYGQSRSDQMPYMQAGQTSLADLMRLQSDPNAIQNSPAYQFRLSEGQKALERSAAAGGGLNSGRFMKGLTRYGQGLASDEYGNQWNRLYQLAGMGQNSAQNLGALGGNYANSMSQLYGAQGNAQAAGTMASYGGAANAVGSLGNMAMMGMGGFIPGIPGIGGRVNGLMPQAGGGGGGYGAIPTQNRINPVGRY